MDKMGKNLGLERLRAEIDNGGKITILSFEEFLKLAQDEPQRVLRNIFQMFYDMVKSNIVMGEDEYPGDPESIGFVPHDCSKIFVEGADNPFFADRLLANRFAREIESLRQGSQQNRIYVYYGPPGSGKSTFLNNLLQKFQDYANTREGQSYEIFWDIDIESDTEPQKVEVPCPSHDHPILIIPRNYRAKFLEGLLAQQSAEIRQSFANEKEYEWLLEGRSCTICESIFCALCEKLGSFDKVLTMVKVRPYRFSRRMGEGISIFNPGDKPQKEPYSTNQQIQGKLDQIFGVNRVRYVYSQLARTNNGIYVLMDIKSHNEGRLLELHNVISEGVHKVDGVVEETINSLFFALMNLEDIKSLEEKKVESFVARIRYNKIPFVMEAATEVKIYRSIFGSSIDSYFLPRVLDNFARVIIASRMKHTFASSETDPIKEWISGMRQYAARHLCDEHGLLLRMEIYGGVIPTWLSEEDKKNFTAQKRRDLIAEAANDGEGDHGFSGRDSIKHLGEFLTLYGPQAGQRNPRLITMSNVIDFFKYRISRDGKDIRNKHLPQNFLNSLVDWYDYAVLNEVKEAIYFYNRDQIREDILHYLCAVNYNADGRKIKCQYTGKEIEVTTGFLKLIGSYITGEDMNDASALKCAQDIQKKYAEMIAQNPGRPVTETDLYKELFNSYIRNLKENALKPFVENESFREAVKAFGSKEFETFDTRIKEHVVYMINNLMSKFGYTEQGAKEICLYVLDQRLVKKFSK